MDLWQMGIRLRIAYIYRYAICMTYRRLVEFAWSQTNICILQYRAKSFNTRKTTKKENHSVYSYTTFCTRRNKIASYLFCMWNCVITIKLNWIFVVENKTWCVCALGVRCCVYFMPVWQSKGTAKMWAIVLPLKHWRRYTHSGTLHNSVVLRF